MKTKLHNKHPVFLQLQDAITLCNKMNEYVTLAFRKADGNTVNIYNYKTFLHYTVQQKEFWLDGWRILETEILDTAHQVEYIVKAVELFDEVELEGYDVNEVILTLSKYERTMYVLDKEKIKLT